VENVYFALTEAFNRDAPTVLLASGQAVVFYRIAIMSKDGDWVIRESPQACAGVLGELESRGAHYRVSAPLDTRWLAAGWSSHFEFADERGRRVRCDFVSRPPRVPVQSLATWFEGSSLPALRAVAPEPLILMKRTQRAKDYAVIGELATLLPQAREIELTTDPDRIIALAPMVGQASTRAAVRAAVRGEDRKAVVVALAEEADQLQRRDKARLDAYTRAAEPYLTACRAARLTELPLPEAHARMCDLAERTLPTVVPGAESHADAE
jgi:hypothetical protein